MKETLRELILASANKLKDLHAPTKMLKKKQALAEMAPVRVYPIRSTINIIAAMLVISIFFFTTEFLPFNEEVVVLMCLFFAFLCIDIYGSNGFKNYFLEQINDTMNKSHKNVEDIKASLAVKGSQEIKCWYSLTMKKIFLYNLFLKATTVTTTYYKPHFPGVDEQAKTNK